MKIYLVVEDYKDVKHVITVYKNYDQVDYSKDAAIDVRNRWDESYGYLGAKYYVKEVEL